MSLVNFANNNNNNNEGNNIYHHFLLCTFRNTRFSKVFYKQKTIIISYQTRNTICLLCIKVQSCTYFITMSELLATLSPLEISHLNK